MQQVTITKLDAARRELRTAIELWFNDGDPVAIHVLAFSAYEIIHALCRRKGITNLIYNSDMIKKSKRQEASQLLKKAASFFKHAEHDPNTTMVFSPTLSEGFMTFAIIGLQKHGEKLDDDSIAFMKWQLLHNPKNFTTLAQQLVADGVPVEGLSKVMGFSKREFFYEFMRIRSEARAIGEIT